MALSSGIKKSNQSDSESDSDDEVRDELPFLRQENEQLGLLLDNRDDMLREAKKMRKELRASLEDARARVAELQTQNLDAKLETDSLKASPIVSDEVDCVDCSVFLVDLTVFKDKCASKYEELDVLRVEVDELMSRPTLLGACTSCPILHGKIDEMHAYTVSLDAKLKEHVPTSRSTCEVHALKNLELVHYVNRLQDENDELRKMMGWLSGHEPQLRMMMETYKHQDGKVLGSEKVGEISGEGGEKIGDIVAPPKTYHKNTFAPKPNPLRNKLNTNPDPPIVPHSTDDFEKPIKFKSTLGNVFFGKERERPSEGKPIEKPNGEKPSEQPQPKPKPELVQFHCDYCGRDGHKGEFFFKRKREEKMAKEWANKDKYHPSNGVLEPRVQMPRAKAIVRSVPSWGDRKAAGSAAGRATPVRPMCHTSQTGAGLG
jgi:outer membrane biosynthesis protein TonB